MQEDTLYRHLLRDSWKMTWRHKHWWLLGFLALFWGNVGTYNALERLMQATAPSLALPSAASPATVEQVLKSATPGALSLAVFLVLIFLALTLLTLWLTTAARGGLLTAIERAQAGRTVKLKAALKVGAKHFVPLLIINLLTRLDVVLYALLLSPLLRGTVNGGVAAQLGYFLAFLLVTLVSLLLSVLGMYAAAYVVLQGERLGTALKKSWQLLARFWLISLELALILYIITFAAGIAALTMGLVLAVPGVLLTAIAGLLKAPVTAWLVSVPLLIAYALLLLAAGSAYMTFQFSVWTLLFLRLREQGAVAKVVRLTARFGHILHRKIV